MQQKYCYYPEAYVPWIALYKLVVSNKQTSSPLTNSGASLLRMPLTYHSIWVGGLQLRSPTRDNHLLAHMGVMSRAWRDRCHSSFPMWVVGPKH